MDQRETESRGSPGRRRALLLLLCGALGTAPVRSAASERSDAAERPELSGFVRDAGRCPARAATCVGLHVHVVVEGAAPVQTPRWFAARLAHANRLFAPSGVGFEVAAASATRAEYADLQTRDQRDALGREEHALGVVHVYLVRRLADVDVAGEVIRGVHWRDREGGGVRRWLILSSIAPRPVLAHELGHFFGLRHSEYRNSIMNKRRTPGRPAWLERVFAPREVARLTARRDEMLRDGTLLSREKPRADPSDP